MGDMADFSLNPRESFGYEDEYEEDEKMKAYKRSQLIDIDDTFYEDE